MKTSLSNLHWRTSNTNSPTPTCANSVSKSLLYSRIVYSPRKVIEPSSSIFPRTPSFQMEPNQFWWQREKQNWTGWNSNPVNTYGNRLHKYMETSLSILHRRTFNTNGPTPTSANSSLSLQQNCIQSKKGYRFILKYNSEDNSIAITLYQEIRSVLDDYNSRRWISQINDVRNVFWNLQRSLLSDNQPIPP